MVLIICQDSFRFEVSSREKGTLIIGTCRILRTGTFSKEK